MEDRSKFLARQREVLLKHGVLLLDRDFLDTAAVIARNKQRRKRLDEIAKMLGIKTKTR